MPSDPLQHGPEEPTDPVEPGTGEGVGPRPEFRRQDGRRLRDMATLLPFALLVMFVPPYLRVFDQDSFLAGLSLLHIYIFGVWALAILASGLIAHRLARDVMEPDPGASEGEATLDPDGGR
jgi:hypothetical protein